MPKPAMLPRAALILCALALTACGPKPAPRIVPLPPELTTCADEPQAPALPAYQWGEIQLDAALMPTPEQAAKKAIDRAQEITRKRDQLMLDFTLAQRSAWGDCRAKVDGARAWNERVGR